MLNKFKEKRSQYLADLEAARNENLEKKLSIIEQIESITSDPDNINKQYNIVKPMDLILKMRKETCLEKYGFDNPSKNEDIKNKISVKNKNNKDTILNKARHTKLEKYGDENYNNIEKCGKTKLEKYGNKNYNNRDKYKETCLERYGVENYFQLDCIKDKNNERLLEESNYSSEFKEIFSDRDKAIDFLKEGSYSYFDLSN